MQNIISSTISNNKGWENDDFVLFEKGTATGLFMRFSINFG